jgi:hypothetical protein
MNMDHIAAAYNFTDMDKQQLINMLAQTYLVAKVQAYKRAISRTKQVVQIHLPWQPTETDAKKAQAWAALQVESIASTYEDLLTSTIEGALLDPHEKKDDDKKDILYYLFIVGRWFKKFLPWKTQQVANVTVSTGQNDGVEQFIQDVQDEKKTDEVVSGGKSMLRVRIEPKESSNDYCKDYAGKEYSLEEYTNLGITFPAHPNCRHFAKIFAVGARESSNRFVWESETTTLFLDIDGVFNIEGAGLPLEMIGNSSYYRWAHPIPQAHTLLQALDVDKDLGPVWLSHWGKQSTYWNYWAGTYRWLVCFPLKDAPDGLADNKPYAIQTYLELSDKRGDGCVWVQDGFTEYERAWAEKMGVRLVDATQEPVRSLLLSEEPGAVQELIDIFAGSRVAV